jgi:hypothetical protein
MTYGMHHDRSAGALAWLVHNIEPPEPDDVPAVFTCRAALINSAQRRLDRALLGADAESVVPGYRGYRRDLRGLVSASPLLLAELLREVPRLEGHAIALTDVLARQPPGQSRQVWVEAARHATLATETVLSSAAWMGRPGRAWQIVADVADVVEAVVLLDSRLAPVAASLDARWARWCRRESGSLRVVARQASILARSAELDPGTDALARLETLRRPVVLSRLEHIVDGVQAAEQIARRGLPSVGELRAFAIMQSDIAAACIQLVGAGRGDPLRDAFRWRERRYRQLAASTTRVASLSSGGGADLLCQTQEIGRQILVATRSRAVVSLGVLADFDHHSPRLARAVEANIRTAFANGRYLVADQRSVEPRWRRVGPGEDIALLDSLREVQSRPDGATTGRTGDSELLWAASRVARLDRSADEREAEKAGRPPGVRPRVDGDASAARRNLRESLERQWLPRPSTPNRRPSLGC